jgi:hypothetical protein
MESFPEIVGLWVTAVRRNAPRKRVERPPANLDLPRLTGKRRLLAWPSGTARRHCRAARVAGGMHQMTSDTSDTSIPAVTATTTPAVPPPVAAAVTPTATTAAPVAAAQPPEADLVILGCMVEALDPGLLAEIRATHDRLAALAAEPATGPPVAALPVVRRITPLCERLLRVVTVIDPPSSSELSDTGTGLDAEPNWLPDAANETNQTYERVAQWSGAADLWVLVERLAATHPISPSPSPSPRSTPSVQHAGIQDAPCAAPANTKHVTTRKTTARAIAAWVKRGGVAP